MRDYVSERRRISIEDRLLLLCARLELSSIDRIELQHVLSHKSLSWDKALNKARLQYLVAFLFHHLNQPEFKPYVPHWAMENLKQAYFRNGLRNRLLQTELCNVLETLQVEGIPVIALKGAALLETVYPNIQLRPMADIDLLVPEELADVTQAKVSELGYTPFGSLEEQEKQRAVHQHLSKLVGPQGLVKFEVHSHIVTRDSPFRFDISGFWERSQPHDVAGVRIRVPSPEHMLIHLGVHFFLDRRFRSAGAIRQICDMAETARYYHREIDWDSLADEVHAYRLCGPVHCGLLLAHDLLDAPIPSEFLDRIAPEKHDPKSVELFVRRRILDSKRVIASALVKPQASYTLGNIMGGVLRRIYPKRTYLANRYGNPNVASSTSWRYLLRMCDGLSLLLQYLREPLAIRQQVLVDRWMHSVSSSQHQARRSDTGE